MANSFVKLRQPLMDAKGGKFTQIYGEVTVTIATHIVAGDYTIPISNVDSILEGAEIENFPNQTLDLS